MSLEDQRFRVKVELYGFSVKGFRILDMSSQKSGFSSVKVGRYWKLRVKGFRVRGLEGSWVQGVYYRSLNISLQYCS